MNAMKYYFGKGVRKSVRAFNFLRIEPTKFKINGQIQNNFLLSPETDLSQVLIKNLCILLTKFNLDLNDFSYDIKIHGGGFSGRKQAIVFAIAHSFLAYLTQTGDLSAKSMFRKFGFVSIDFRKKEIKKIGHPKARKSKPYVKR